MNKISCLKDSSFENTEINQEIKEINESLTKFEKVLCNHCGRTSKNGIRCQGFCVADNDY